MKKNRYDRLVDYVKTNLDQKDTTNIFYNSGIRISMIQYQIIRYSFFLLWIVLLNLIYLLKSYQYPSKQLLILIVIFLLTSPTLYLFGRRTPFKVTMDLFMHNYKYQKNIEIYRAISQLKNIVNSKRANPPSTDFIIEQLRKFSRRTRPVFNKMLALWNLGRREEACTYFSEAIGTKEANELANILLKMDYLKPNELRNRLALLLELIKRERETKKLKINENKSNLVYLVVVVTSMVIMLNFVVIVYYLETINQLRFLS